MITTDTSQPHWQRLFAILSPSMLPETREGRLALRRELLAIAAEIERMDNLRNTHEVIYAEPNKNEFVRG